MPINPKLFKAYDIRGLAPQEITEDFAYRVGQALVKFTKARTIAVGRDMRDTSPSLFGAFVRGVNSQGADAVDVGLVTTPIMYFATANYPAHEAGAMITASHNPKEYNGIKLCFGDALPIGGESGMNDIRDIAVVGPYPAVEKPGTLSKLEILGDYYARLFSNGVDAAALKPLKVVVDTANGMEGHVIRDIFARMPQMQFDGLFLELDGSFPNHEANPLKEETLDALKARIRETGADVGFAFDGDGDRVGLVDEKGENVRGDLIVALLAPELLAAEKPGTVVMYDVRESLVVPEEVTRAGGKPVMCRVGHGLIKPQMRREQAVFAGELSNHFYFRDFFGAESSDFIMLLVLKLLSETGKPLSELVAPLRRYFHSGEINSEVEDKDAVFAKLREKYVDGAADGAKPVVTEIDGLRVDFADWWFSVRASNTEPLLRLNLEAKTESAMIAKRDELLSLIRS